MAFLFPIFVMVQRFTVFFYFLFISFVSYTGRFLNNAGGVERTGNTFNQKCTARANILANLIANRRFGARVKIAKRLIFPLSSRNFVPGATTAPVAHGHTFLETHLTRLFHEAPSPRPVSVKREKEPVACILKINLEQ